MARALSGWLAATVALAVPVVLAGNALWVLLGPALVDVAYAMPGFPDDHGGLDRAQRTDLANTGVDSVHPLEEGVELLREAKLPDGRAAFGPAEIRHMADVRALTTAALTAWAIALALGAAAGAWLHRRAGTAAVMRSLRLGALGTLGAMAAVGLFALVAFDSFFAAFHGIFFEGDTWRFADDATLRRVYPDAFWGLASAAMALAVILQAGTLALIVERLGRRGP